jgi:hypothetical protein
VNENRDRRAVLHSAFTFVRSVEANRATAAITLDHVIEQQVKRMKRFEKRTIVDSSGKSYGDRVSYYDRLTLLAADLNDVISEIEKAKTEEELVGIGIFEAEGNSLGDFPSPPSDTGIA